MNIKALTVVVGVYERRKETEEELGVIKFIEVQGVETRHVTIWWNSMAAYKTHLGTINFTIVRPIWWWLNFKSIFLI